MIISARPKTFILGNKTKKMRKGQKNASIVCLGYGYPNPKATWKINGKEIQQNSNSSIGSGIYQRRSTNDLPLKNVTSTLYFNQTGSTFDDYGNYTCEVTIKDPHDIDSKIVAVLCKFCLIKVNECTKFLLFCNCDHGHITVLEQYL